MVGSVLDPARHRCLSGPAAWRVVLEATILRWIVRRRDDNAVCQSCRPPKIVERENGVRYCLRWRIAVIAIYHGLHAIGREHFEGGRESWLGQRVRVFSDIERPADALAAAVVADRLRHRENVRLIERANNGGAPMATGAESDSLRPIREVRLTR